MPITVSRCGPTPREFVSVFGSGLRTNFWKVFFQGRSVEIWHQSIVLLMLMELRPITSK